MIWLGLIYLPFWFSMLKYKKAKLILLEGNSRSIKIWKSCLISQSSLLEANTNLFGWFSNTLLSKPHTYALHWVDVFMASDRFNCITIPSY